MPMTYYELWKQAEAELAEAGVADAALDARYLLQSVSGFSGTDWLLRREEAIPDAQQEQFSALLARRKGREPLQYLLGTQEFMGESFLVTPAVLIPRQDTECLVELAMKVSEGKRVLDICTGSGCILISLAKRCQLAAAHGTDISGEALAVAKENAVRLQADVVFWESDMFSAVTEPYDVIVSNPPYIPTGEQHVLMPEVGRFEPALALYGGDDGLAFYRILAAEAPKYLADGGRLFCEIGCEQGAAVAALFAEAGFSEIAVTKDYAGLDRVVSGVYRKDRILQM